MKKVTLPFHWKRLPFFGLLAIMLLAGCEKEVITVPDNDPPWYDEIPTSKVENYVNRIFIDLVGREPLNSEMAAEVQFLKDNDLAISAREQLILKLQSDTSFIAGDSSYKWAYHHRVYELTKARLIEGASESEIMQDYNIYENGAIADSLLGDSVGMQQKRELSGKLLDVVEAEAEYYEGDIGISEMYRRMIDNSIYDRINMNTFNYVNATFDDMFYRFPTQAEFDVSFDMIEYNQSGILFQQSGQNKGDYAQIMVNTQEFHEGIIRWTYLSLLAREATTAEVADLFPAFFMDKDLTRVQRSIMVTDEYANF